jgi:parallel beta-helix repeat protein
LDGKRFDHLSRAISGATSRRGLLGLVAAVAGGLSGPYPDAATKKKQKKNHKRGDEITPQGPCGNGRGPDNRCTKHKQCCSRHCDKKKRRCRCRKLGQSCRETRNCCANAGQPMRCQGGICKQDGGPCAACTSTQLCIDDACQDCDVCASGCAFDTLQPAIDAADAGDTITICAGSYGENITIDKDLTIIGAGDDGGGGTNLTGTGGGSVVTVGKGIIVALQDLRTSDGSTPNEGGGITNQGTLSLTGCTVTENTSTSDGGGIFNNGGTLTMTDCTISGNRTDGNGGGGIISFGGTLELNGCTITENTAPGSNSDGGGIFLFGSTAVLTGCTVSGNAAGDIGGGLLIIFGEVTLDAACRVTGNAANADDPESGGGIYTTGATVTLASEEIVTGNTPDNCGGDPVPMCVNS